MIDPLRMRRPPAHTIAATVQEPIISASAENVELRRVGEIPSFDFEPRDHVALATGQGWLDVEAGARLAGSRNYVLKGDLALLENAMMSFALDHMLAKGFELLSVPMLVRREAMEDLRVAVRRSRSVLKQLGNLLPRNVAAHFKRELAWLQRATGPARDLDVHLSTLPEYREGLRSRQRAGVDELIGRLEARRGRAHEELR